MKNYKTFLLIIAAMVITGSLLSKGELETLQEDQQTEYDRCMANLGGSERANECPKLLNDKD